MTGPAPASNDRQYAVCNTCTIMLVALCYERVRWFRVLREPLLLGMRVLSRWHRIDPRNFRVRTESCYGCIRFMKESLKEKSYVARRVNDLINPMFNRIRDSIVTEEEIAEAKRLAREATHPPE
ncbi:MAG: nitroreductase [Deltaproteobacteria bacterium]|nr:nitroreductase [Deltaproteobacteria bacterium]